MRRAHICWAGVLIVLALAGTAPAPLPVIDDFESYWGTPALQMVWTDTDGGSPSTSTAVLLTSGASQGQQAMEWDYYVAGGWEEPGDPTNYNSNDRAMLGRTIPSLDFQPGGSFELYIRPSLQDLDKTIFYVLEYGGDGYGQTLIPTYKYDNPFWWPDPPFPAIIAPPGWTPPPRLAHLPVIYAGQWGKVVIKEDTYVPWGQALVNFDAMTSIGIGVLSGWTDTSAPPKFNGTDALYPAGSISGRMDVDAIYYIPEPATVALLGLGGWVIVRKRK